MLPTTPEGPFRTSGAVEVLPGKYSPDPFGRVAPKMFLITTIFLITHLQVIQKRQMSGANFSCDFERRALPLLENNAVDRYLVCHIIFLNFGEPQPDR